MMKKRLADTAEAKDRPAKRARVQPATTTPGAVLPLKLAAPTKRIKLPGKVRRLTRGHPSSTSSPHRASVTQQGSIVSAKFGTGGYASSSILKQAARPMAAQAAAGGLEGKSEELWITRKAAFPYYLKLGLNAFIARG